MACSDLDGNDLKGQIPAEWGAFGSTLYKLRAKHNKLTGTLPSTWSEAELLKVLDLRWNRLEGSLPESWSMLRALEAALLGGNALSGPLPEEWAALSKLAHLSVPAATTLPEPFTCTAASTCDELLVLACVIVVSASWPLTRDGCASNCRDLSENMLTLTLPKAWSELSSSEL